MDLILGKIGPLRTTILTAPMGIERLQHETLNRFPDQDPIGLVRIGNRRHYPQARQLPLESGCP